MQVSRKIEVLIVEYDSTAVAQAQAILNRCHDTEYEVATAPLLSDGLAILETHHFDVLVLGLTFPDAQDLQDVRHLRSIHPALPIVVVGEYESEHCRKLVCDAGAEDYLVKDPCFDVILPRAIPCAIEHLQIKRALIKQEIVHRNRSEEVHKKSEQRLQTIANALPVLIAYVDSNLHFTFNNKAYEEWLGIPLEDIEGQHVKDIVGESAYREMQPYLRAALGGNKTSHEGVVTYNDNQARHINATYIPDIDDSGTVKGLFSLTNDISERINTEEEKKRHLLELAHVSRLSDLGEMASEIAHEINQPLTAIANYGNACLHMLQTLHWDHNELVNALDAIVYQAQRAGSVIRGLSSFVRKDEGHRSTADINALVATVIDLVQFEARSNDVRIRLNMVHNLPRVLVNKVLIEQVIMNLTRNAIEAMAMVQDQPRELTVHTLAEPNGHIKVVVEDTGLGLVPHTEETVFQPFFSTKPKGMGMGLSICRSIIEAHNGRLWAESREPKGSRFQFCLPAID